MNINKISNSLKISDNLVHNGVLSSFPLRTLKEWFLCLVLSDILGERFWYHLNFIPSWVHLNPSPSHKTFIFSSWPLTSEIPLRCVLTLPPPPGCVHLSSSFPALLHYLLWAQSCSEVLLGRLAASWLLVPWSPFYTCSAPLLCLNCQSSSILSPSFQKFTVISPSQFSHLHGTIPFLSKLISPLLKDCRMPSQTRAFWWNNTLLSF